MISNWLSGRRGGVFVERINLVLTRLVDRASDFLPNLALAAVTVFVGLVCAYALQRLTRVSLHRLERSASPLVRPILPSLRLHNLANGMARGVFWLTILVFVILASEVFGFDVMEHWIRLMAAYLPNILGAFLVFVTGTLISQVSRDLITRSGKSIGIEAAERLAYVCYIGGLIVTVLVAIKQVGIEIEFLTTGLLVVVACLLAGGAISFGFGSAPVVTNILSAYYAKKTIKVGSQIIIDGLKGRVVEVTPTSFILESKESRLVIPGKRINEVIVEIVDARS